MSRRYGDHAWTITRAPQRGRLVWSTDRRGNVTICARCGCERSKSNGERIYRFPGKLQHTTTAPDCLP